jgi:hypothetical protein
MMGWSGIVLKEKAHRYHDEHRQNKFWRIFSGLEAKEDFSLIAGFCADISTNT